jgi:hypothetical protein
MARGLTEAALGTSGNICLPYSFLHRLLAFAFCFHYLNVADQVLLARNLGRRLRLFLEHSLPRD